MISWVFLKLLIFNILNCGNIKNSVGGEKGWGSCSPRSWGHSSVGPPVRLESHRPVGNSQNLEIDFVIVERAQTRQDPGKCRCLRDKPKRRRLQMRLRTKQEVSS